MYWIDEDEGLLPKFQNTNHNNNIHILLFYSFLVYRLFYRPLILVSAGTEASLTPAISRCIYLQDRDGVDLEGVSVINGDISH